MCPPGGIALTLKEGNVLFKDTLNTFYLRLYGIKHNETKEGNVLFNDALNTFYLRLYGIRYWVSLNPHRQRGDTASSVSTHLVCG